jgi:cobalt-zinc-cadmium efflux system outer membrane protein
MITALSRYFTFFLLVVACMGDTTFAGPMAGSASSKVQLTSDRSGEGSSARALEWLLRGKLTANNAVQIALMNNQELQSRLADLNIADDDLIQAGLLKNPVFDFMYRRSSEPGSVANIEGSVALDFLDILYLPMRKAVAQAQYEQTRLEVNHDVLSLAMDVKSLFYKLSAAEQTIVLLKKSVDSDKDSYEAAVKFNEAGNESDLDMHREQAVYEEAKIKLADAQAEAASVREELNLKLGLWGPATEKWVAPAELPALPPHRFTGKGMESLAVYQRLDLAAARQHLEVTARQLGGTNATGWLSSLQIGYDVEREAAGDTLQGPSISIPFPLFDHGQARSLKARSEMMKACYEYYGTAVKVRQQVRAARAQMFAARDKINYYDEIMLPLKQRIVEESLLMYNAMEINLYELLVAKRDEISAGVERVSALRDYWIARSELERAMGGRLAPQEQNAERASASGLKSVNGASSSAAKGGKR